MHPGMEPGGTMSILKKFAADNQGATAVEYGLVVAVLSAVVLAGFTTFSGTLQDMLTFLADTLAAR